MDGECKGHHVDEVVLGVGELIFFVAQPELYFNLYKSVYLRDLLVVTGRYE